VTDQRDPIEDWLGSDVELMHPPPGTFQHITRRARQRKMTRALTTVAGAAMIIAAGVTAPQIAATLLPGGNGSANVAVGSGSPGPVPSAARQGSTTGPVPKPGTGLSDTGNPAPPRFRPTSVTFIDSATGAALGQAGPPCPKVSCTTVAGTTDYGRSWFGASTVPAGPPDGSLGVSQIRFLDARNGWAFGPQLFATHDGGGSWRQVTRLPAGRVVDLSTVGGRAYAVLAFSCTGTGQDYAAGCQSFSVISAAAGSDRWGLVPGAGSASGPARPGGLQIDGLGGYLIAGRLLIAGSVTGGPWNTVPNGAPGEPSCLSGAQGAVARHGPPLLAPNGASLYLACDGTPSSPTTPGPLTLYLTADGGRSWRALGVIGAKGTAASLAVAPSGTVVLATTTGIYYSPDGKAWHQAGVDGRRPDRGYAFVGMTTNLNGVAVPADSGLHELFVTRDGGQTWQPSRVR
jgi:photosystem II stability/assembly factor-like uncharacterized protein